MEKNLGLGVMIRMLQGNERTVGAIQLGLGKVLTSVRLEKDDLHLEFEDDTHIAISDEGQSCCEHRYMMTDDDLPYYVGAVFEDIEIKDAPNIEDGGEVHEVQFLEIKTSKGVFTMATHNEHNGYYGGFSIEARVFKSPTPPKAE